MRKNFFRTLTAAAVMACLMTVPAYAESATVTGDYVNIRTGPGIGYGVVECLRRGAQLTVTDRSNSSWYAVEYDGLSGFMASGYLAFSISPSNEYSGLISFRMDWFDLLEVQGTLKSLLQHHSSKHQFFSAQLSLWSNSHIHT